MVRVKKWKWTVDERKCRPNSTVCIVGGNGDYELIAIGHLHNDRLR